MVVRDAHDEGAFSGHEKSGDHGVLRIVLGLVDGETQPVSSSVMPGLVPGIHDFLCIDAQDVDARDKPGHDGKDQAPSF